MTMIVYDHFQVFNAFFLVKQNLNLGHSQKTGHLKAALGAAVFTFVLSDLGRRKNWKPKPSTAKPPKVEHQHVGC